MKKLLALALVSASCFSFVFVGALHADEALAKIWPPREASWYFYTPKRLSTTDEAIANIKNLQNKMILDAGTQPSDLDVDKYGMRAKTRWIVTEKGENVTSTSGGFWIGWNYIPTNTTTSQPWAKETPQEKVTIIPFKDITGTVLLNGYVVAMGFANGEANGIIMKDMNAAHDLLDSLYTLREALSGVKTEYPKVLGLRVIDMTPEQKEIAGITYGVMVVGVADDGPAELAGITYADIIIEVNGEKVESSDDCIAKIMNSVPEVKLKIIRWADERYLVMNNYVSQMFNTDNGGRYSFQEDKTVRLRAIKANKETMQTMIVTAVKK